MEYVLLIDHVKHYIKGMCMGVADVIPGVSGGTLALMLNIYERLISGIKSISPKTILPIFKNLLIWKKDHRSGLVKALNDFDAFFLVAIGMGIVTAVLALSSRMPHLIMNYTAYTFACFLGLIVPSISIPWKMIKKKAASQYIALILGTVFTIGLTWFIKSNGAIFGTDQSFGMTCIVLFFCAVVAISAMILPGISGSFILMLLGQYVFLSGLATKMKMIVLNPSGPIPLRKQAALSLVEHLSNIQVFVLIGIFLAGCLIGIILMSKVIHFALQKAHDTTMAFLTGMICSSAYVLWPFKQAMPDGINPANWAKEAANIKLNWLKKAPNITPEMTQTTWIAIGIFIAALIFSTALIYFGNRKASDTNA